MALKRKITKAEHEALAPLLKAEYKAEGESFVLDAEGFDDPAPELRRALDRVRVEKTDADNKAAAAAEELRLLKEGSARSSGNVDALEKSYKEKMKLDEDRHKGEIAKRDAHLQRTLVDAKAQEMATRLGGENAALLLPHIKARLTADLTGDEPLTRVLDANGKPSAFSVADLENEFKTSPQFKSVVIVSNASGAGGGNHQGGNSVRPGQNGTPYGKKFNELTEKERVEWHKTAPGDFVKASELYKEQSYPQAVVR